MQRQACIGCNSFVILRNALISGVLGGLLAAASPVLAASAPADTGCAGPAYSEFDFWLGDWRVHLADGRQAGENRIEKDADGCFIREQWSGSRGSRGFSVNVYQPDKDRWRQLWISRDSIIDIEGGLNEAGSARSMVLNGTIHNRAAGETHPFRGRWTPLDDGRVRQFFEEKLDGEWQPWFEGFYTKVVE